MLFSYNLKAVSVEVRGYTSDNNEQNAMNLCNRLAMACHDAAEYNRNRGLYATAERYQALCDSMHSALERNGFYSFDTAAERKGV